MRLALPLFLAELVHVLYSLVDRMFIGHIPHTGSLALAGVGIAFPLISFLNAFASLCGTGSTPLCAIARGSNNHEEAEAILETAFTMLLILGVLLISFLFPLSKFLLVLLGAGEETLPYALIYFRYYVLGSVFILISLGINPLINMQGNSIVGMVTVLAGAILNIILDPIFIFTLGLGVKGAAIASVISQFVSALWATLFLTSRRASLRLRRLSIRKEYVGKILQLGITGFMFKITNSLTQAVFNVTLSIFGGVQATLYLGSMSIINSIREVVHLPAYSITSSGQAIQSYNFGAMRYSRDRSTIRIMTGITFIVTAVSWFVIQFFPEAVVGIFTNDIELKTLCITSLKTYFVFFFMMSFQMVGQNTFVAHNCPRRAVFFTLFRKVILVIPLTLVLPRTIFGAKGVFIAEASSQLIGASLCFLVMYVSIYLKLKRTPDGHAVEV